MGTELHLQMGPIDIVVDPDSAESLREAALILSQAEKELKERQEILVPLSIEHTRKMFEKAGYIHVGGGVYLPGPTVPPIDWSSPVPPEFFEKLRSYGPETFDKIFGEITQK